jgi:hypothetical protein
MTGIKTIRGWKAAPTRHSLAVYYINVGSATVPTINGEHGGPPYDNLSERKIG